MALLVTRGEFQGFGATAEDAMQKLVEFAASIGIQITLAPALQEGQIK